MFDFFIFRITSVCDKKCPTCCCKKIPEVLDADLFEEKLQDIKAYHSSSKNRPVIFLTGGEPFLYKKMSRNGTYLTISSLVARIRSILSGSKIIIKTGGWTKHPVLDKELSTILYPAKNNDIEIRIGFNLFQHCGANAEERLTHMLSILLRHQSIVRIETIYDKTNIGRTFTIIGKSLAQFVNMNCDNISNELSNPENSYRLQFPFLFHPDSSTSDGDSPEERLIELLTMPAYPGLKKTGSDGYYEATNNGYCPNIKSGPDHIIYNPDFSYYHCNDAFADHSIDGFPPGRSTLEEFCILDARFEHLRKYLMDRPLNFDTRLGQCTFCTHFIHSLNGKPRDV